MNGFSKNRPFSQNGTPQSSKPKPKHVWGEDGGQSRELGQAATPKRPEQSRDEDEVDGDDAYDTQVHSSTAIDELLRQASTVLPRRIEFRSVSRAHDHLSSHYINLSHSLSLSAFTYRVVWSAEKIP